MRANTDLERRIAALEREIRALRSSDAIDAEARQPAGDDLEIPSPLAGEGQDGGAVEPLDAAPLPDLPPQGGKEMYSPRIEWERLFGVRAAAVLGGIALALAGLLFFKYSIQRGLISPSMRVLLGTLAGLGCLAASEWWLRRAYGGTADAVAGAGIVILYAAFWAASALFELIPLPAGFVLMAAVTATGCVLAARHSALLIALLGLAGGFATPLLLSSGSDRPISLFGYVLLLDLALLGLAQQRGWPLLALLSLAGTVGYQLLWIVDRMGTERLELGLVILGLFAAVFAVFGRLAPADDRRGWRLTQTAAVMTPFAFALWFGADADFGPDLHGVAALLVVLSLAAAWLAEVQGPPALGVGAAAASLGVVTTWVLVREPEQADIAWQIALWPCVIAAAFHLFVERRPARADRDGPSPAAILATGGFFLLLTIAALRGDEPWPWLTGWTILAALLIRHGGFVGREYLNVVAAAGIALALSEWHREQAAAAWFPTPMTYLGTLVGIAAAFHAVARLPRSVDAQRFAWHGAALLPVVLLLDYGDAPAAAPLVFLVATFVLGALAAWAGIQLPAGGWLLAAVAATAITHFDWTTELAATAAIGNPPAAGLVVGAFAIQLLAVVAFTAAPFLAADRLRDDRLAWPAAALAGPAWFPALKELFELRFGSDAIAVLPLGLGLISLAALARARQLWAAGEPRRDEVLAWFAAVALGFLTVAIPLQLEREWITIAWALEGAAVLLLWRRLDQPGLKYFGVALLIAVTIRLVANPGLLGYHPRPAWRIVNWLLYTYWVPAAALFVASRTLTALELPRLRSWERALYANRAWGAIVTGFAGLLVVFVWINLAIADWFGVGEDLVVSFERLPARDLTTSIAWAVYALLLLALGVVWRSIGLRWVSLGLLLITIAKVFLYDLGELRDLYRVASLLGLAISLIAVSLAYQRFVFRADADTTENTDDHG